MLKVAVNSVNKPSVVQAIDRPDTLRIAELLARVEVRMLQLVRPVAISAFAPAQALCTSVDGNATAGGVSQYHLQAGGQRMRARLALHASIALGLSEADAISIASAAELLHNASLIHDDLQDRDTNRRGRETAWFKFGDNAAICSGDLMLSAAYAALATFSKPLYIGQFLSILHSNCVRAVEGQLDELNTTATNQRVAARDSAANWLSHYEKIVHAKSGALLNLPLELALAGAGMAQFAKKARNAANAFALGYQIADDINDVEQDRVTAVASLMPFNGKVAAGADINLGGQCARWNIVLLLEQQQNLALSAVEAAMALAQGHLQTAITQSQLLPCDAGAALQKLAQNLAEKLKVKPAETKLH